MVALIWLHRPVVAVFSTDYNTKQSKLLPWIKSFAITPCTIIPKALVGFNTARLKFSVSTAEYFVN